MQMSMLVSLASFLPAIVTIALYEIIRLGTCMNPYRHAQLAVEHIYASWMAELILIDFAIVGKILPLTF